MDEYEIVFNIIKAAHEVHTFLGPNKLECNYESCLAYELRKMELVVEQNAGRPFKYKGKSIELGYRMNLIIENKVLVEVKSVEQIYDVHKIKLLTFMEHTDYVYGIVINFNVPDITDGIKRVTKKCA